MTAANEATDDAKDNDKDHGVLYIGMDLGTSRTAISASNGVRECMFSLVGYPKDHVARKLLGKDVLIGKEAAEKRLSLQFYRPLEKGVLKQDDQKSLKAAADLIRAAIAAARSRKDELIYCVIGAPAQASIRSKEAIIEAARESVDSVMLCSEPFAVAYGLDMLEDALVIDIGAGTADLCRMHGTMPEDADQITIDIAGDAIDEELARLIRESCPGASFSTQMVKDIKERYSFLGDPPERVMVDLPVDGKPTSFDITDSVKAACGIIVPPLIAGLKQLIASFDPEFQHKLRQRVLLAGGGSMIRGLESAIERAMARDMGGGKVIKIEEPIYGGSNGALKIAHDMPKEFWEDLR
ncbi:MAG: rod shape-determining protein [Planctomycetes bacterium]|nr:rod shape-determining protein [Planctomycetota bacterium]MCB9870843.1 rod shape-determining protein [Planctomycetota bacterium]